MRIMQPIQRILLAGFVLGVVSPALADDSEPRVRSFNPSQSLSGSVPDILPKADLGIEDDEDPFISGANAYSRGDFDSAIEQFEEAAGGGHPLAQWKLGRMYQDGDGVDADAHQAFKYFTDVALTGSDEPPSSSTAPFVAYALVAVGKYYLTGIDDTEVRENPAKARKIFRYAASFYGNAEAQYNLGKLYFEGVGGALDKRMAARWLKLAARKGQHKAQALLGRMMFLGDGIPQRASEGLMWLTIAREHAKGKEDEWILADQERAFALATETERRLAIAEAGEWSDIYGQR